MSMSILDFLPFRRRPRPPDESPQSSGSATPHRDDLPPVANITRLYLLMLLFSRP